MTENSKGKIGGLLLAAGGSSRLGRPKQLVKYQGKTLIRRAAETLVDASCDPIVVVLGAEIDGSTSEIADLPVQIYINQDWETGMSSSIRTGLKELLKIEPDLAAVIVTLCDQPYILSSILATYITRFDADRTEIIAAQYEEIKGVPALFPRIMFEALLKLVGDKGAGDLIRSSKNVLLIDLAEAVLDIDTLEDLNKLSTPC
ncbi:MAG: nucleotidyltransferase family protein [Pyrinomonadaceae bacterium]